MKMIFSFPLMLIIVFYKHSLGNDNFDFEETFGDLGPNPSLETSEKAVKDLIYRLIGDNYLLFNITVNPEIKVHHKDVFMIFKSDEDNEVRITASSGVAGAWGFHYYLKHYCECHVSWDGNQITIPPVLPSINITVIANDWFRYYQNVCTSSYSFVWWTWERWEKEIDWMALNGFNLVLAFNGQEEIWRRVYQKQGMTDEEIGMHFTGPGFLAWNRMGNMRGWGGALTQAWHEESLILQKNILSRMRELGITPVLPAFAGILPRAFSRIYPNASLTMLPKWNSFTDEYCWMLQGWLFKSDFLFWTKKRAEALLTSVPLGKMMILDLQAELSPQYERLDSFFGQPFVWCMLHNFGGTLGMYGSGEIINTKIFDARQSPNSTMVGLGITPEGINQNYVIYDLLVEMFWREEPTNLTEWFKEYSIRRYGQINKHSIQAWNYLKDSVYNYSGVLSNHGKYILVRHPQLNLKPNIWYNETFVYEAWKELLFAADEMEIIPKTFKYDIVDLTRQVLQIKFASIYSDIVTSYQEKNITKFLGQADLLLSLLDDLETILASNSKFLLGVWLSDAKKIATSPLEGKLYEKNARNQITLWGPNGEIKDYANKQWSGLIKDYYKKRWEMFLSYLNTSLTMKTPYRQKEVTKLIFTQVEQTFTYSDTVYPITPTGNPIGISKYIYGRWGLQD